MGAVYRARDEADGTVVAIKVLRSEFAERPDAVKRFQKEARLLGEVNNPHVTNLIEVNEDAGIHYLVMEYVEGTNLREVLNRHSRLDERAALALLADVCRALVDAHKRGIIHRDVKPENILLLGGEVEGLTATYLATQSAVKPKVKLSDFGLARRLVQTESVYVTQPGAILGTPLYMPPEQCSGSRTADSRSDVYSLGVTLFELLAGRPPFQSDDSRRLIQMHLNDPPPSLRTLNPEVSEAVCQIVEKALAKEPEARYPNAGSLLLDVERLLRGEPTDIHLHPHLPPCDPGKMKRYNWTWELDSSPEELWPYVANTERLNRAVKLPAVQFTVEKDGERVRRFGRFRKAGFTAVWEEHPFEWVEGQRLAVLREYSRGPLKWLASIVELQARPGGGTTLTHRLRFEPKGFLARLVAAVEIGFKGRRALDRVYRQIDGVLTEKRGIPTSADPFEPAPGLSRSQRARLAGVMKRLGEVGVDPEIVECLGAWVARAPAQEVARIRPLALARQFRLDPRKVVEGCLHGAREGLFILLWDILCPVCRQSADIKDTLRAIAEHGHCEACQLDFNLDLGNSVEVVFRVAQDIRAAETRTYCVGGPAHSPHVIAQVRAAPGESMALELRLPRGHYSLRSPHLSHSFDVKVQASALTNHWDCDLSSPAQGVISLRPGSQLVMISNPHPREVLVRLERATGRGDALTGLQASSLALFRELFPDEVLSPGNLMSVTHVTFLVTELLHADRLYAELGEARAFRVIREHFQVLEKQIASAGGAVVKALGEGVFAVFERAMPAVLVGAFLRTNLEAGETTRGLCVRCAVHRGPARVATVNDRLDYFGLTVKQALHLPQLARENELIVPHSVATDPYILPLLSSLQLEAERVSVQVPGVPDLLVHRFRLPSAAEGQGLSGTELAGS
jgi:class 3 adenylate cyclase